MESYTDREVHPLQKVSAWMRDIVMNENRGQNEGNLQTKETSVKVDGRTWKTTTYLVLLIYWVQL